MSLSRLASVSRGCFFGLYPPSPPTGIYLYSIAPSTSTTVTIAIGFTASSGATSYAVNMGYTGSSSPITFSGTPNNSIQNFTVTATGAGGISGSSTTLTLPIFYWSMTSLAFGRSPISTNTLTNNAISDQNNSLTLFNYTVANARTASTDATRGTVLCCNNANATSGTGCGGIGCSLGTYTAFTFTMWIKPLGTSTVTTNIVSGINNNPAWGIQLTTTRYLQLTLPSVVTDNTTQLTVGTWYFIALAYNTSGGYTLYLNGNSLLTFSTSGTINLMNVIFGTPSAATFYGNYSTLMMFTSTLTQAQIQSYKNITNY